ncbi:hypothetical protein NECAME_15437 [Necator americanus]|uniref:Uncharacterized protein n=1 Tax=Necator americanus TaxID=51031 RepID=W2SI53_NECAM|nr:hypothetical protein NECAME_15437 [Necator americanus]ETN69248.1 hypothetical protein NECAME_15437 [Necator americanus]
MFMHPPLLPPVAFIPTHIPPPPPPPSMASFPRHLLFPPMPLPFYIRPPPPQTNISNQTTRPMSPLPITLPLTITPLKSAKNMRRRSSGSSAQSMSCAASTSSASICEATAAEEFGYEAADLIFFLSVGEIG